ncbi:unnamed protein product [Pleuronectes platessa]|uniref:Uncharacterized protein n=1 Tax=Pleuronectes platessa TaxID=8262 RepID=A0A9N7VN49_PLEPL|nr:unnamed protein product [Pleuronectes platessa]
MELPGIGEQSDRAELMTWLRMDFLERAARLSLGSSAPGQDRIPELVAGASSLSTLNHFLFGQHTKESVPELCCQCQATASAGNRSVNRGERAQRGCRHRGESDGRSRA